MTATDIESAATKSTTEEARTRAERIRAGLDSLYALRSDIAAAYQAQDWTVLGYDSWAAYVDGEFVGARLRLPRDERRELVSSLREAGLSTRAIAAATKTTHTTVERDLAQNVPPDPVPVTGLDGKSYPTREKPAVTDLITGSDLAELNGDPDEPVEAEIVDDRSPAPSAPKTPRRTAIGDTARSIGVDGRTWARRLDRLLNDDRLGRNRESVGSALRAELDVIQRTIEQVKEAIN